MEIVDETGKVLVVRTGGFSKVFNWRYQGRLSRSQFFCVTMAIYLSIYVFYSLLQGIFAPEGGALDNEGFWVFLVFIGIAIFFFMRTSVLRLHDMGAPGGWCFLAVLFLGFFYVCMCFLSPSNGVNSYGEPPVNTVLEKWFVLLVLFLIGAGIVFAMVKNLIA
ncbi:MAG: DUF805 domain-containing protein [Saezia sp.]